MRSWLSWLPDRHQGYDQLSTRIKPNLKQLSLVIIQWILATLILGVVVFFCLFQVDLNSHISIRSSFSSNRPSAGPLSSRCSHRFSQTRHVGIIPSVPVKEADVCFDYAKLIQSSNASDTLFHTYWSSDITPDWTQNQLATLRSFLATQPSTTRLYVWTPTEDRQLAIDHPRIQLKSTSLLHFERQPPANHLPSMVKLLSLYEYGGVWMDLDVLLVRDLSPLLYQEWLSQSSCHEKSQLIRTTDARFTGALMHFFPKSPYLCEMVSVANEELRGKGHGLEPLASLGPPLYERVYYRMLEHQLTPWAVLPWCFTDPSQCTQANSITSLFSKRLSEKDKAKVKAVFAYHYHQQWYVSPGALFNYLDQLYKQMT
ncbi:hypothetical protein A0J61_04193 [Choanephora cucurbitarum]|uniref:Uncharacterized protein n=1 Tax=Choanephora cucurbitarum TaxID=101091 RepID=A0A1C7NF69_9FUNG|nr:hypothetical protein A0J61_04193 [Choanephora cucurbitarum]